MADGMPKDYSRLDCEDNSTSIRHSATSTSINNINTTNVKRPIPSTRARPYKSLDGLLNPPQQREQGVDLRRVVAKLESLPKENHRAYAIDTLNEHYTTVFNNRCRPDEYRVYIKYFDDKDTYVVRVERNTLRAVRDKLPKRGNYRYFFKRLENTCEEIEFDDATVPFLEKNGLKQIYCQVFPF